MTASGVAPWMARPDWASRTARARARRASFFYGSGVLAGVGTTVWVAANAYADPVWGVLWVLLLSMPR